MTPAGIEPATFRFVAQRALMKIFRCILVGIRIVSEKSSRENKTYIFQELLFFRESFRLWDHVKNLLGSTYFACPVNFPDASACPPVPPSSNAWYKVRRSLFYEILSFPFAFAG